MGGRGGEKGGQPTWGFASRLVLTILEDVEAGHYSYKAISSLSNLMRRARIPREELRDGWQGGGGGGYYN